MAVNLLSASVDVIQVFKMCACILVNVCRYGYGYECGVVGNK